ncbi:MAG: hypothetical protein HAW67_05635 [Endozoicomonadaceae bacterium]|nr:hypothetical protein [Endozoicomonadaceae bacterium]
MILPTKHIAAHEALIGAGAIILEQSSKPIFLSQLWEAVKATHGVQTYERFVLALDMLYIIGTIEIKDNMIIKVKR